MTSLRERLDDAATAPAPPSRLTGRGVYAAAWRRRRSRQRWAAAVVGGATVVIVAAVSVFAANLLPGPSPTIAVSGGPAGPAEGMPWSVAADRDHLYVLWSPFQCEHESKSGCPGRLLGSDDGGKTWTERYQAAMLDITAPAPGVLRAHFDGDPDIYTTRFSTDGGRNWRLVQVTDAAPVAEVPQGGWAICTDVDGPRHRCTLRAVDPGAGEAKPLANQPGLTIDQLLPTPVGAGLWVSGYGPDNRGGVAVSHDGGRTWRTHLFDEDDTGIDGDIVDVATVDGTTAYAVVATGSPRHMLVHRTTDGGQTWQAADPGHTLPYQDHGQDAYLAADGTHVVRTVSGNPAEWYAGQGGSYTAPAPVTGLPAFDGYRTIMPVAPGMYLTNDVEALYTSPDGLHWTRRPVAPPVR
jgi:hypothetical protein